MGKRLKKPKAPDVVDIVYIQRVQDGDGSYLLAYTSLEDVELESGDIVGVYTYDYAVQVLPAKRTAKRVD